MQGFDCMCAVCMEEREIGLYVDMALGPTRICTMVFQNGRPGKMKDGEKQIWEMGSFNN